ncbi:PqiC family protein [Alishewanella sp. d11]|uniref:PqiC family protein n=1 Tax=Alishewanella sp. d11 TaxID=3414030 RepID=UPI003BF8A549
MKLTAIVSCTLLVCLVGCSSPTNDIRYYQLVTKTPLQVNNEIQQPLTVAPIKVANYLNGSGLVLRQSAVEFNVARQHLWADALEQQLQRQLLEYLLLALPNQTITAFNTPGARTLQLDIHRFYADEQGQATVSGYYTLSSIGTVTSTPFAYQVALADDGYPAMVQALSQGWQQLLQDLVMALTADQTEKE